MPDSGTGEAGHGSRGVAGSRRPLAIAKFLAERLPKCRLAMLGAGHFVWEELPDPFAHVVGDWIDEHNQSN